jgi:flagellar export protein FliJ
MKKFKFTLQSVHKVREMREENEQMELSRLQAEAEKASNRISEIEDSRQQALEKYMSRLQSQEPIHPYELELNSNHISSLDRQKQEALAILEQKKQACAKQRETVAVAMRAVKITNRLRETQEKRHKTETERHDQTATDELVSATYAREMSQ